MEKNENRRNTTKGSNDKASVFHLEGLDPAEQALYVDVKELINNEAKQADAIKRSTAEQKKRRLVLGEKLSLLKAALNKPGRGSGWAGFLRQAGIGIRKADRWVAAYERTLHSAENSDSVRVPATKEQIEAKVTRLVTRLRKELVTAENFATFIDNLQDLWKASAPEAGINIRNR